MTYYIVISNWNNEDIVWENFYRYPRDTMDSAIRNNMVKWVKSFYVIGNTNFTCSSFLNACCYNSNLEIIKFIHKVIKIPQDDLEEGVYDVFRFHGKNAAKEIIKETNINIHKLFVFASKKGSYYDYKVVEFMKFLWNLAKENPKMGKIKLHENEEEIFIDACCDLCDNIGKIKWLIHISKTDPYADGPITQYHKGFTEACEYSRIKIAKYLWNLDEESVKKYNFQELFMKLCWKNQFNIAKWMVRVKCIKKIDCRDFATDIFKFFCKIRQYEIVKLIYEMSKNGVMVYPIRVHDLSDEELWYYNNLEECCG